MASSIAMGTCHTPGCSKDSTLQCPKCRELSLPPAYFCSQACFKTSWAAHKKLHVSPVSGGALPAHFASFNFTGPLRPTRVTPMKVVPPHIKRPDYADNQIPVSEVKIKQTTTIEVLNATEIAKMRKVCKLAREVLDIAARMVRPGVTTDEIDCAVHAACIERNSYPSPLNYHGFPKSCCTSVNEIICHGIPDLRPLCEGDIVNLDITLYHDGVHGDLNETFFVGAVDDASKHLVRVAKESLDAAIASVKPGVLYRDIGAVVSKHVHANNLSVVKSYCGHGIHKHFHCPPNVPHYAKNKAVGVMAAGHVFTIEPMINQGTWHDVLWPDDWTSATRDGRRSAQFEHTLLVTPTGCEVLTAPLPESPATAMFKDWESAPASEAAP